jgi:hypothetical protein
MRTELVFHNTSGALFFWHAHIFTYLNVVNSMILYIYN